MSNELREKSDSAEREKLESWSRIKRKIKEKKEREEKWEYWGRNKETNEFLCKKKMRLIMFFYTNQSIFVLLYL